MEIAAQEQIALTENGAKMIARLADGAMRDALSMLDRTAGCETVDEEAVSRSVWYLGCRRCTGADGVHQSGRSGRGDCAKLDSAYDSRQRFVGRVRSNLGTDS